ncbi:MAG: CoA transferase, partial [Gammaproteobacteria bacterium]|nr:CoA transferase [Gammaproteobacteria bacterium]
MTMFYGLFSNGLWADRRGSNLLDGGAPFYRPYRTADGGHVFVAAIEPRFFAALLETAGIDDIDPASQMDRSAWPQHARAFERVFATRSRDAWAALFAETDACVAPVLSLSEAPEHAHNRARHTFVEVDGVTQPAPAPRFSRTPSAISSAPGGAHITFEEALARWEESDE